MNNSIKKKYVEMVLRKSELKSDGIVNMHRLNTQNSGDLLCAPYLYFKELEVNDKIDISGFLSYNIFNTNKWTKSLIENDIILGGGGFLDREYFEHSLKMLQLLMKKGRKVVPWGIGHNNPTFKVSSKFYNQIKNFKLVGIRDYGIKGTEWVPCVSCMNPIFDDTFESKIEIGIIEHEHIKINSDLPPEFPTINNNVQFKTMIEFIGGLETLITNSYHAMYWAMLMKKKVIVIPNSSKMFSFKYKVPICNEFKDYKKHLKETYVYDQLLDECRDININFSKKVFEYLSIS